MTHVAIILQSNSITAILVIVAAGASSQVNFLMALAMGEVAFLFEAAIKEKMSRQQSL